MLQAAVSHRWQNLEVVGDSALILRQLRDYRPPRNAQLLRLYSKARRLADLLEVRHWHHHVRSHNKMADSLANLAMVSSTSSQVLHPTTRSGHATLPAHLSNDLTFITRNRLQLHHHLRFLHCRRPPACLLHGQNRDGICVRSHSNPIFTDRAFIYLLAPHKISITSFATAPVTPGAVAAIFQKSGLLR
jgi:hypothetical protein